MGECNLVVAGVGGQGIILFSRMLAEAALRSGFKAIVGQSFTAAQRYGSVVAFVRIGKDIYSPLIGTNQANIIVGLEPLEVLRYINLLSRKGLVLLNVNKVLPVSVILKTEKYPEISEIEDVVKQLRGKLLKLDATQVARSLGDERVMNMVMLGALSTVKNFLISSSSLVESIKRSTSQSIVDKNIEAFHAGRHLMLQQEQDFNFQANKNLVA
jgi:indolepyruvate ferredoxin oxidoreductase beta subunit